MPISPNYDKGSAAIALSVWLEAKLEPHVPTFTTVMQCSTSMVGVFEAAGMLGHAGRSLALVGACKICADKIADDRTSDGKINKL